MKDVVVVSDRSQGQLPGSADPTSYLPLYASLHPVKCWQSTGLDLWLGTVWALAGCCAAAQSPLPTWDKAIFGVDGSLFTLNAESIPRSRFDRYFETAAHTQNRPRRLAWHPSILVGGEPSTLKTTLEHIRMHDIWRRETASYRGSVIGS